MAGRCNGSADRHALDRRGICCDILASSRSLPCIVASVGCDGESVTAPRPPSSSTTPPPPPPSSSDPIMKTVEFGGRVVDADGGGPVASARVAVYGFSSRGGTRRDGWRFPTEMATSGGDGTFTLPLTLPDDWTIVFLKFTGPTGYDDTYRRFEPTANPCAIAPCWAAADRSAIRMYPTLVIRPGESIQVRLETGPVWCGWDVAALPACAGGGIAG